MRLTVYKGFDKEFLSTIKETPLVDGPIENKLNIFAFDKSYRKSLEIALISLDEDDEAWVTYEECAFIKNRVEDAVKEDSLKVTVIHNNVYPDYYPLPFSISDELFSEINNIFNGTDTVPKNISAEAKQYTDIYSTIANIDDTIFGSFYNFEYYSDEKYTSIDYYQQRAEIKDDISTSAENNIFINDDIETYLRDLMRVRNSGTVAVGVNNVSSSISSRMLLSLQAYCFHNNIKLYKYHESLNESVELEDDLKKIAIEDIKIQGFTNFRTIKFYKNPDISKEVVDISQAKLIQDIITQAENSYNKESGKGFRDIFITASTGAGKSVMFQIPAIYLAKKYHKLTIIIEPVIALMQDQKEKLIKAGYTRVETFNSDLITQVEKERALDRIKSGEVDLLYLSPETLLSYSIETLIGDREIGLFIIDEAHIVTTWGVGFRPDYWYLGGYINKLRNAVQTYKSAKRKTYRFPVCAFTATAINGGIDDSVDETVTSLYMENPIKYIGYVKRDDISFDITHRDAGKKLPKHEYEDAKCKALEERINTWIDNDEKTIVYFPYATLARDAYDGTRGFSDIKFDTKKVGTYTGRNIYGKSLEAFKEDKRNTFEGFANGSKPVMFATKAFGMGIDVKDVKNVYHYAASGNLCDYVQEIGRAARKVGMNGVAITDFYYNDMNYMKILFGMSKIKQYQIKKVLEGVYSTYKNKKESRNFLISPGSFTYIFDAKTEDECINRLKTCLLMLEKDLYEKNNFKVLISRPQGIFTKAFICISKEKEELVKNSKYAEYIKFVKSGRYNEKQIDDSVVSDIGDIYSIDLKSVWEQFHPNLSFPQFKYYFFSPQVADAEKVLIMPEIREYIYPRQRIGIETRKDLLVSEVREKIITDFEYIADTLYATFGRNYFTTEDFRKLIKDRFGDTQSRIIANSLFDLVDPDGKCVKHREDALSGKRTYCMSNGNFKSFLRSPITKSSVVNNMVRITNDNVFSDYISTKLGETNTTALKLMSIFDYITYEIAGGEEPEIFIRLNDPELIRKIIYGTEFYSNYYVTKAQQKHDRDVRILNTFFNVLSTDQQRWNFIEEYFLGYDVLSGVTVETKAKTTELAKVIDKNKSYSTSTLKTWGEIRDLFDDDESKCLKELEAMDLPIPDYLQTEIKKSDDGKYMLMVWSTKNVVICAANTTDRTLEYFESKGWHSYKIDEIDLDKIQGELL